MDQQHLRQQLIALIQQDVDDFLIDYLVSVTADSQQEELEETLGEFLISYELVEDEEHAYAICERIRQLCFLEEKHEEPDIVLLDAPVRIADRTQEFQAHKRQKKTRFVLEPPKRKVKKKWRVLRNGDEVKYEEIDEIEDPVIISGYSGYRGGTVNISEVNLQPLGGGSELIIGAKLLLVDGRRYGLIGRNGAGKTTLLRAISSRIIDIPEDVKVVHVLQECPGNVKTPLEVVLGALPSRKDLETEMTLLTSVEDSSDLERVVEIQQQLAELDEAEEEARVILKGLQFSNKMIDETKTSELSGGWRMRVSLATALNASPDVLLLDEPTNHLDFPSVLWLEDYLTEHWSGTLVVVSHDRYFLNNITTDTIHLRARTLTYYRGNYDSFERLKAEQMKNAQRNMEALQRKQEHIQQFVDKFRYNAKRATMVQSRLKTLDKLQRSAEAFVEADDPNDPLLRFEFPTPSRLDNEIIDATDVCFRYNDNGPLLLKDINIRLTIESRVGVLGKNGAGKTTLLRLILRELEPTGGYVTTNIGAKISVFTQHHVDQLNLRKSGLDHLMEAYPKRKSQEARAHLGRFGLSGDLATRAVGTLSGGQKSRVSFAAATFDEPHLIIMDEPTNHLDMETIDALLYAMSVYQGGVICVSHDQYFLRNAVEEYWNLRDGTLHLFHTFEDAQAFSYPMH